MKIEQVYTSCLAQGAYYIESNGEVAIIDPLRETRAYIEKAKERNAKIKYVLETHFHADFVSGHLDLANQTGATIVYGPGAETEYESYKAKDSEVFKLGDISIKVLHTPGHTLESTTYLLQDENEKDHAIFSGDTLFLGDVGRPDLAIKSNLTKEDLAEMLFDSLREKIMPLGDDVIVYPAHGAGSACGKSMSKETVGTIGEQKRSNYALRADMTKAEFVKEVLDGMTPPPQYFAKNAMINKTGYDSFEQVLKTGNRPLNPEAFEAFANEEGTLVLDVRPQSDFIEAHIPNAIFIGLNGQFAPWVGALITNLKQPILLVVPEGKGEEAVTRLSRVGYDNTLGYLEGGMAAWKSSGREVETLDSISAETFAERLKRNDIHILDVRRDGEYAKKHLQSAQHFALDYINSKMSDISKDKVYHIHCAGGYRSVIAASILKSRGFHKLVDVAGGFGAIKTTNLPTSEFVEATS